VNTPPEVAVAGEALSGLARAVTSRGLPFRFKAKGGSMSPFLRGGDVVTIRPLVGPPRFGDIVAFCRPGDARFVVHRVIGSEPGQVLIRGDAVRYDDGWVPADCVLGRVVSALRDGRALRVGLGHGRMFIALLSRAGLLVPLLYPVRKLYRQFNRIDE
jgi:hypothetical protein